MEYSQAEIDRPTATYDVQFVRLMNTNEYKKYAALQTIYIGDTVKVRHIKEDIDLTAKVISYEYDPMQKKYTKISLGSIKQTLSGSGYGNLQSQIDAIKQVDISNLEASIDRATGLLNTALGGYVLKRNGELLIMDTEDITTAVKVWRWNLNGLGYSGTGYAGPYRTAITNDGHFVADFIDVGLLKAEMIQTGFNGINEGTRITSEGLEILSALGHLAKLYDGGMEIFGISGSKVGKFGGVGATNGSPGTGIVLEPGSRFDIGRRIPDTSTYIPFFRIPYNEDVIEVLELLNMKHQEIRYVSTISLQSSAGSNGGKIFDANGAMVMGGYDGTSVGWLGANGVITTVLQILYQELRAFGTLNMNGNIITNQSDIRLKKNVVDASIDPLSIIEKMRFINFEWDESNPYNEKKPVGEQFGIEAQYSPFLAVQDSGSNYLSIDMGKQVNVNSMALQWMVSEIKTLKEENAATKKELADLKQLLISKGVI